MFAAVQYARSVFPAHAVKHEHELQAAMCALAWLAPSVENGELAAPPTQYAHLLDQKALGMI